MSSSIHSTKLDSNLRMNRRHSIYSTPPSRPTEKLIQPLPTQSQTSNKPCSQLSNGNQLLSGLPISLTVIKAVGSDAPNIYTNHIKISSTRLPRLQDKKICMFYVSNAKSNTGFAFLAHIDPDPELSSEHIALSTDQRLNLNVNERDEVNLQLVNPKVALPQLTALALSVCFASDKATSKPYDQEHLASWFHKQHNDQPLAPGQSTICLRDGINIRFKVIELGFENGSISFQDFGIFTSKTDLTFYKDAGSTINIKAAKGKPAPSSILQSNFKFEDMGIGGLDEEFSTIFRRAFASRIFPPDQVSMMGLQHCRGMLLYGPPGTGKTLIARQIGKMLQARPPKIINGPEVLNKYVGQSEENIRKLFADAEKEYKEKANESGLHIIIFDELDAVCKQRGSGTAGGTGIGDSVVNQLLSKLDGVDQLNNILIIGMTNRLDMIDNALLRPGRLELHIEISLPSEGGRHEILKIHTATMKKNNKLASDVDLGDLAGRTKNFSGAEIVGLVRAATSFAFSRHIDVGNGVSVKPDVEEIEVKRDDFKHALDEVKPAYGVSEEALEECIEGGVFNYSWVIDDILRQGKALVNQVSESPRHRLLSGLFWGPPGSGKTALAAKVALDSGFPFIRRISPNEMQGFNDTAKIQHITRIFSDAHRSPRSIVLIDSIETIIDYSRIGPRFSNNVLMALSVAIADSAPPKGRRLLVLATTSKMDALKQLQFDETFVQKIAVPAINILKDLDALLELETFFADSEARAKAITNVRESINPRRTESLGVGIKKVLFIIESAKREDNPALAFGSKLATAVRENAHDESNTALAENGYAASPNLFRPRAMKPLTPPSD